MTVSPPFHKDPKTEIQWDYKYGCRVIVPAKYGKWSVRMIDHDREFCVVNNKYDEPARPDSNVGTLVLSNHKFFVRWRLEVDIEGETVIRDIYDAKDKPVILCLPSGLGDVLTRMRAVKNFVERWKCKPTVTMPRNVIQLFEGHRDYRDYIFLPYEKQESIQHEVSFYGGYAPGFFDGVDKPFFEPYCHRIVPNIDLAAYMLGTTPDETPPRINVEPGGKPVNQRYVCIAKHCTTPCKEWQHPEGWKTLENWLGSKGYKVFVVDNPVVPLVSRARLIKFADFFIGSTGGMGWIAWCLNVPSVTISGFSNPSTSFINEYHVTNPYVCNSCFNRIPFDKEDLSWCPEHKGTSREWECSKQIMPEAVIRMCERLINDNLRNKK